MTDEMTYVEKRKAAKAAARQQHESRYRALVKKLAECGGKLPKGEESELEKLQTSLGIDEDRVGRDQKVFEELARLEPSAGDLVPARTAEASASSAIVTFDAEEAERIERIRARRFALLSERDKASKRVQAATKAEELLTTLRNDNWQLLACEDPAVTARRFHLAQTHFGDPIGAIYRVIEIEQMMSDPNSFQWVLDDLSLIMPLPGKSDSKREINIARGILQNAEMIHIYMDDVADEPNIKRHRNLALFHDGSAPIHGRFSNWNNVRGVPNPNQSDERLREIEPPLRERAAKERREAEREAGLGGLEVVGESERGVTFVAANVRTPMHKPSPEPAY